MLPELDQDHVDEVDFVEDLQQIFDDDDDDDDEEQFDEILHESTSNSIDARFDLNLLSATPDSSNDRNETIIEEDESEAFSMEDILAM